MCVLSCCQLGNWISSSSHYFTLLERETGHWSLLKYSILAICCCCLKRLHQINADQSIGPILAKKVMPPLLILTTDWKHHLKKDALEKQAMHENSKKCNVRLCRRRRHCHNVVISKCQSSLLKKNPKKVGRESWWLCEVEGSLKKVQSLMHMQKSSTASVLWLSLLH